MADRFRTHSRSTPGLAIKGPEHSVRHDIGQPAQGRVFTSHVERSNLSIRMATRRFTRLTNAFSKKWHNHQCALALWFAFYNFGRVQMTLRETPAMASRLENHVWTIRELIEESAKF